MDIYPHIPTFIYSPSADKFLTVTDILPPYLQATGCINLSFNEGNNSTVRLAMSNTPLVLQAKVAQIRVCHRRHKGLMSCTKLGWAGAVALLLKEFEATEA